MPRYVYRCGSCDEHFQVRHGMKELQKNCLICQESGLLTRVPQMPNINKKATNGTQSAGKLTDDFIEKNKQLLSDMKKEARNQIYDD